MNDWLRVTTIGGGDYECRMTILKTDDTTITITRPWHHHWTDGWDWKTIIRQWLSDVPEILSDEEKKRLASRLGFERIAGQKR